MSTVTELSTAVQDQVLAGMSFAQGIALDAIKSASSTVDGLVPKPAAELVGTGLSFVEKVLDTNHAFVKDVLSATAPKS